MPKKIGVLDLQGDVVEHLSHFRQIGVSVVRVRKPQHLANLAGLVIPGGESTCLWRLLGIFNLDQAIAAAAARDNLKLWGTCAGAILMSREVLGEGPRLGLMEITVARNAFGGQLASFQTAARIPRVSPEQLPLTFIRAPQIVEIGPGVEKLLEIDNYTAMAESETALATVFHPEMTPCLEFHRYFARKCGLG